MASRVRKCAPSRKQEKKRERGLSFLRWLPLISSSISSSPSASPSAPKTMKPATAARRLSSYTTTPCESPGCVPGSLVRLSVVSPRYSVSSLFMLSLFVLTLAGVVYLLIHPDSLQSTSEYALSLSGPGLSPEFTLPLRYLYITLTPSSDSTSTNSWISAWWQENFPRIFAQKKTFALLSAYLGGSARKLRPIHLDPAKWSVTWELKPSPPRLLAGRRLAVSSVVDRGAGVYILRFRLLQSVPVGYTLEATISHSGESGSAVGDGGRKQSSSTARIRVVPKTFTLKGPVYAPFSCPCPSENGNDGWLKALQCPATFTQLSEDLSSFPVVDLHRLREESRNLVGPQSLRTLVHYVVKDNQVYRRSLGPLPGFQHFSDAIFSYLTSVVKLPDVEFLLNLGDWPAGHRQSSRGEPIPLFGWSGGKNYADIILPQWDVLKTTLFGLGGEKNEDLLTAQTNTARPLEERIPKALFRGRDSHPIRVGVVRLARKFPSLVDAEITSWERDENAAAEKELAGGQRTRIPLRAFADYKYQLLLDGTVAAYRTPYLLHSGSVPLKHESEYYEWFYGDLQPMVHFIPFKADLSDLIQQLQWAETHPKEAAAIAENAQSYARQNLTPEKVVCYYYRALTAYAQRQNTEPRVDADMLRVEHEARDAGCSCPSNNTQQQQQHARRTEDNYPLVPVYPQNVGEILQGTKKGVVLVTFSSFCNNSGLYMPKFLRAARLFAAKEAPLLFGAADGYRYSFPPAYSFCNFPGAQPKVMFLHPAQKEEGSRFTGGGNTEKSVPEYMAGPLTLYNTVNFVNRYLPEQYHVTVPEDSPDVMSQPLPTDNDQKLVKTVVGANFDDLVLHNTKDVLLFVHAAWCGLCKHFKLTYEAFAEAASASPLADTLVFTKMNGSENRLRYKEFSWSSYPVLWHVSGADPAQRKRPTQFRGPWNFAGLQNFVQKQTRGVRNV